MDESISSVAADSRDELMAAAIPRPVRLEELAGSPDAGMDAGVAAGALGGAAADVVGDAAVGADEGAAASAFEGVAEAPADPGIVTTFVWVAPSASISMPKSKLALRTSDGEAREALDASADNVWLNSLVSAGEAMGTIAPWAAVGELVTTADDCA
jgi:hypothetical protein